MNKELVMGEISWLTYST